MDVAPERFSRSKSHVGSSIIHTGENELSTGIHFSLLPDSGHSDEQAALHPFQCGGPFPQTASQNKAYSLTSFFFFFIIVTTTVGT